MGITIPVDGRLQKIKRLIIFYREEGEVLRDFLTSIIGPKMVNENFLALIELVQAMHQLVQPREARFTGSSGYLSVLCITPIDYL